MRQQINLYQPIFSQERKQLSATTVATALGVIGAVLLSISMYANRRVDQLEQEVANMRERAARQQDIVAKAGELHAARGNPDEINARVKQLADSVAARQVALKVLQQGAAGQTTGFASRLEALARRHIDGLWIDGLVLSGTNGSMTLRGATLQADTVPTYLQGLAHEAALAGTRFDDFVIEQSTTNNNIRFRAGSKALAINQPEPTT